MATTLHTLANLRRTQSGYQSALALYQETLQINRRLGDRWMLIQLLEDIGWMCALLGQPEQALRLVSVADTIRQELKAPLPPGDQVKLDQALAPAREALGTQAETIWAEARMSSFDSALDQVDAIALPT